MCSVSLYCLISVIQIVPRQQLLNQSYLQEETHLHKFYADLHVMRKIWCCWTADKCDLHGTAWLGAINSAAQTSHNDVCFKTASVLFYFPETLACHQLHDKLLTLLLTSSLFPTCPLTEKHFTQTLMRHQTLSRFMAALLFSSENRNVPSSPRLLSLSAVSFNLGAAV